MTGVERILRQRVPAALAAPLDALLVIVFAAIGRTSHEESMAAGGVLATAAPFLVGAAAGWAAVRALSHAWPSRVRHGITVWAVTVVLGMLLRAVTGAGTAWSFVVVATLVLGVFLVGWRLFAGVVRVRATG